MKKLLFILLWVCLSAIANQAFAQQNLSSALADIDSLITGGAYQNITSLAVAHNGEILFEQYYNGANQNSLHNTRSATKTITSILVGIAIDKGFIPSIETKAFRYFEDKKPYQYPDPRKEDITIADLLSMNATVECNDDNQWSRGNEERMYLIDDYYQFYMDLPMRGFAAWDTKPEEDPYGQIHSYCTAGTALLGGILERAAKMPLEQFASDFLFKPLGITDEQWQITPMGVPMTGGGLQLSTRDFMKIITMINQGGMWKNQQILSKEWIAESIKARNLVREFRGKKYEYGYLWWLQDFPTQEGSTPAFYMTGNGGSKIAAFPQLNLEVVVTGTLFGDIRGHFQSEEILERLTTSIQ